jgi:hypothetical protein
VRKIILQRGQTSVVQDWAPTDVMTRMWRRIVGDLLRTGAAMFD